MADVGHVRGCFVCIIGIYLALTSFSFGGQERHTDIVHTIKSYKDVMSVFLFYISSLFGISVVDIGCCLSGNRLAVALEAVPEESTIPNLSYTVRTQTSYIFA
jgi:hypothetical protein